MSTTPIEAATFRAVLGHFASGVCIVTGMEDGSPVGLTCQSFFSLSIDPPLIAIAPAIGSTSWPRVAASGAFCVNILSVDQEAVCRNFAVSGGDKFAGVGWSPTQTGSPRLHDVLAWIDCSIERVHTEGDHLLVIGRVHDLDHGSGEPLLFYRAGFGSFRA
jgi:3-hydroxy-9,10-secoandrosta-1,3,5(10)-triene-9,17-dione monooxygenase reductase component